MYSLKLNKGRYYRVKAGQNSREIEATLLTPVNVKIFDGAIIEVFSNLTVYKAEAGDSYNSIAQKFNADMQTLIKINGGRAVYPTAKIFVPVQTDEKTCRDI